MSRAALLMLVLAAAMPAAAQVPGQPPAGPPPDRIAPAFSDRPLRSVTPREVAVLRGLDTFSGQVETFPVAVGRSGRFERIEVRVLACNEVDGGDGYAFLEIVDLKNPGTVVFRGWMVASSPALSGLDHPRYDIWLAACSTASG